MSTSFEEHPDALLAVLSVDALPTDERQNVERHLATCVRCRARLRSLQTTAMLLHSLPAPALPRSFVLETGAAPRQVRLRPVLPLSFLSAAAVLFLALGLSLSLSHSPSGVAASTAAAAPANVRVQAAARFSSAGAAAATTGARGASAPQSRPATLAAAGAPTAASTPPAPAPRAAVPRVAPPLTPVPAPRPPPTAPTGTRLQGYQVALALGGVIFFAVALAALAQGWRLRAYR